MTDNHCAINIPAHWTALEAIRVCDFLGSLVDAIWHRHGDAMCHQLAIDAAFDEDDRSDDFDDPSVEEIPW